MHPYLEYVNPELGNLLTKIGLDKRYVKGESCFLYDEQGNQYLDFIAAYGALPFGFNPPEIWQAINQVQTSLEPSLTQPSLLEAAAELGKRLVKLAPKSLTKVTFANSGTEAVEAAIKLARAKTSKHGIVATYNSFHGKTLGALSATGNPSYQKAFGAPVAGFEFVPYGDIFALEQLFAEKYKEIAALIIEPIQGEGGIVEPPAGYLQEIRKLCSKYDILLIFDEIQTGLGRTGKLFSCEFEQVIPDIMTIAKALSGGLIPIGAVLCTDEVYTAEFGNKHSSTFAGNALACRVGIQVLELLTRNNHALITDVARKGEILKLGLEKIQQKYPTVIKEIRGRGLMLGVAFNDDRASYPDSFLGIMAEQKNLSPIIASYLLNVEKLRVAPTLNGASVIRIEPPLIISEQQIEYALRAIENTAALLAKRNTAAFLGHLIGMNVPSDLELGASTPQVEIENQPEAGRFAFLVHPLDVKGYSDFDQSLEIFSDTQLAELTNRWHDFVEPFVVSSTQVTSATGKSTIGDFIVVPYTAEALQALDKEKAESEILKAIAIAVKRGAKIVGLGAYTSVVTAGGRSLLSKVDVPLTTGNSYTVVSGVDALIKSAKKLNLELHQLSAAIVGAGGAIGKASAMLLGEKVARLTLIGNPSRPEKSEYRMLKVMAEMYRYLRYSDHGNQEYTKGSIGDYVKQLADIPKNNASLSEWIEFVQSELENSDCPVIITVNLGEHLPHADIVLAATSSTETLITSENLKAGAVICDMSRPSNVSQDVLTNRNDVLVIDGGVIEVPGRPSLGWNFGFEKGLAFACMSETIILGLEHKYENTSIGADLNIDYLNELRNYADLHGFKIAGFRSFDAPLSQDIWERVVQERKKILVNDRGA